MARHKPDQSATSATESSPRAKSKARRQSSKNQSLQATGEDANRSDDSFPNDSFPIVGVGASAGGLKALKSLLGHLPDKPALAFVVIQHLDPTRESLVPQLLSKLTGMQVCQVEHETHVQPNRVYVLPPGKYLSISGGELHLSEPDRPRSSRMAIDFFLRSLATDQHHRAVAIILSGTGTDGTLGIKAVKAAGGLVIAQEPSTADFDGMPQSAIDSGIVDHTLSPEAMSDVLVRYAQHPYVREAPPGEGFPDNQHDDSGEQSATVDGINAIIALLRAHSKHDFRCYKDTTLVRRTRRRMCLHHIDDYDTYLQYLGDHRVEIEALTKDLLISVTDFFREPDAWESLRTLAIRPLVERHEDGEPIRVWTPGCATGEEPYSVAMLILEELKRATKICPVNVFASDVDADALEFARDGRYPKTIQADISAKRLQRFFTPVDGEDYFRVVKTLREAVVFAEQDLITDPPFSRLDLVCCRNLLIYLKPEVQEKVIALFHFALRDGGVLLLGSAETVGRQTDLFAPLDKRWRIFRRLGPTRHDRVEFPISDVKRQRELERPAPPLPKRQQSRLTQHAQQRLLDMLAPAAVVVDSNWRILFISGDVNPFLTHRAGAPTDNLLDKVRSGLRSGLRAAVYTAVSEDRTVSVAGRVQRGDHSFPVSITVRVIHDPDQGEDTALVVFEEHSVQARAEAEASRTAAGAEHVESADRQSGDSSDGGSIRSSPTTDDAPPADLDEHAVIQQLEDELAHVREDLQASIEQFETSNEEYKASNEEVMSINEELQSTNEELETSKEELQSLNEELSTVNSQLAANVANLETSNADLQNLVSATSVATICVDTDLAVRWFTPAAQEVVRLRTADIGRPLADLANDFADSRLVETAAEVLKNLVPVEDEATCTSGRTFIRQVTPYRTHDHCIGGVVITFINITERKRMELSLRSARELSDRVIDIIREATLVLDADLRIVSAKRSFHRHFQVSREDTEGRLIYDLGNQQWDIPELRRLLENLLPENGELHDFEVDHDFEFIGRRIMLLNAQRLDSMQKILLAIEDVTEHRLAQQRRTFLLDLSDALRDADGPQPVVDVAVSQTARFLKCDRAAFAEIFVEQGRATILSQYPQNEEAAAVDYRLSDFGIDVLQPLLQNQELVIDDVQQDERLQSGPGSATLERYGMRALCCIHRWRSDGVLTVLAVGFHQARRWTPVEIALLRDAADRTWSARDTARALQDLQGSEARLSLAAAAARFGSYSYDFETHASHWSHELRELLGLTPHEPINRKRLVQLVHPDDRQAFQEYVGAATDAADKAYSGEFRFIRPDGQTRWMADRGRLTFSGEGSDRHPVTVAGMVMDVTEKKRAAEELLLLKDVTVASNEAQSVEEAVSAALKRICEYDGWKLGHSYQLEGHGDEIAAVSSQWYVDPALANDEQLAEALAAFLRASTEARYTSSNGMIGHVLETGRPCWIDSVADSNDWQRPDPQALGLGAAVALPVFVNGQIAAIMEYFADRPVQRDSQILEIMYNVGIQLGHVIQRTRLLAQKAAMVETEQQRIGQDIHDGVGQELTGLRYLAQTHADSLVDKFPEAARIAQRISGGLEKVQRELRSAVRDLVPVELDEQGFVSAVRSLAERVTENRRIKCVFECERPVLIENHLTATHLYRIAQEAVSNAIRHANAKTITIRLTEDDDRIVLHVIDDGIGIGPEPRRHGLGLGSMMSRAGMISGRLNVESPKSGGTVVTCTLLKRSS